MDSRPSFETHRLRDAPQDEVFETHASKDEAMNYNQQ